MKIIDVTCPNCGAALKADFEKGQALCEYCGSTFLLERQEAANKEQNAPEADAKAEERKRAQEQKRASVPGFLIPLLVIGGLVLLGTAGNICQELAKPKVNPFDCIAVSFLGRDGEGEVEITFTGAPEGIDGNLIDYNVSRKRYLYQGETVTIQAESDAYRLAESARVYTVEGLDEYLKDLEDIPEEALELIHARAVSVLDRNLERSKNAGTFLDMRPVKLFLLTDSKQTNEICDVFEVRFQTNAGEYTCYVMAAFDNVIIRDGEQVSIDMSYGMYYGDLTQIYGSLFIMAYDSVEEVRVKLLTSMGSAMELKELELGEEPETEAGSETL